MVRKQKQRWMSFYEGGIKFMLCKACQSDYVRVEEQTVAVTCWQCVHRKCVALMPLDKFYAPVKHSSGKPAGWHFMNEFVDKDGNVFHKGKEQPELKGTLKPTKVKPRKKKKKLTADEKLYKDIGKWKKRRKTKN